MAVSGEVHSNVQHTGPPRPIRLGLNKSKRKQLLGNRAAGQHCDSPWRSTHSERWVACDVCWLFAIAMWLLGGDSRVFKRTDWATSWPDTGMTGGVLRLVIGLHIRRPCIRDRSWSIQDHRCGRKWMNSGLALPVSSLAVDLQTRVHSLRVLGRS